MTRRDLALFLLVLGSAACGPKLPPVELRDARTAFVEATKGPAPTETPAYVEEAKRSLDRAEQSFYASGRSREARDLAYIAARKAQVADAAGRAAAAVKARQSADLAASTLGAEKESRAASPTTLVIAGADVFEEGTSRMHARAQSRLEDVMAALEDRPQATVRIEVHTRPSESREDDIRLAQERADAVRDQLVTRGVAPGRILTVGVGPDERAEDLVELWIAPPRR